MVLLYVTEEAVGIDFVSTTLLQQKTEFLLVSLVFSFLATLFYHFGLNLTASGITEPLKVLALITARFLRSQSLENMKKCYEELDLFLGQWHFYEEIGNLAQYFKHFYCKIVNQTENMKH